MKPIKQIAILAAAMTVLGVSLAGCNAGEAGPGMSKSDADATFNNLTPEQKIKFIASGPAPEAEKQKQYAEIEAKTGVKAADVLTSGKPTGTGAGG